MHIPSHVLSPEVAIATAALSIPFFVHAARKAAVLGEFERNLPRLGAATIAVLGMQALNVAIPGGSSAHLLGATALAIAFGPRLAMLGMAFVYAVQAFFFGDGGIDALGANILNGAIVGPLVGWAIFQGCAGLRPSAHRLVGAGLLAGAISLLAGATLCVAQLALSGAGSWEGLGSAMLGGSLSWALFEGASTAILATIVVFGLPRLARSRMNALALFSLGMIALFSSKHISSSRPDVLESAIETSAR